MYDNDIYSSSGTEGNNQQIYSTYRTMDMNLTSSSSPDVQKAKDKKGGFVKKAFASLALGLIFGGCAGAGFYGVQQGMNVLNRENVPVSSERVEETQSDDRTVEAGSRSTDSVSYVYYTESDITEVVEEVMPAMVSIVNNYTEKESFFGRTYEVEGTASGSGIIVADNENEILIVTNNHVVDGANNLEITFIDGTTAAAVIKGTDADMDLAVIAVNPSELSMETHAAISVATLGDSDELKLGEPVIAIGNALGYGQSVTNGIISALNREMTVEDGTVGTFIQTNAAINHGNSGGALLNIKGEVIGINSNKIDGESVEGMGYAIPISSASPIIAELMERQTRVKVAEGQMGYIGIELQEVTSQIAQTFHMPEGIYVVNIVKGGGAEKAGIITGDIITKFDGQKVSSYADLQSILQYYAAGEAVEITVMRAENGEYNAHTLELTLGTKPSGNN